MASNAWKRLMAGREWFRAPGRYPIMAYSEFMPPPRLVRKAYGTEEPGAMDPKDPWGWQVSEYEETFELRPGLAHLGAELVHAMQHLAHGRPEHGISWAKLEDNPFWPAELAGRADELAQERYVILAPLALARTQDDKGRVRWTVFGGSEQGPARPFWKSFWTAPDRELPEEQAVGFLARLLNGAFGESIATSDDLWRAGFRILPGTSEVELPYVADEPLPSWADRYLLAEKGRLGKTRYLLTFRPFGALPKAVQRAYLAGDLCLLPFPGSLVFWGARPTLQLQRQLPLALQVPLLHSFVRSENPFGLRVPQAGWMHEPHFGHPEPDDRHGPLRNKFRRTHRWERVHRHEDELAVADGEDHVAHVLFSTASEDLGLYDKPMARNAQIWTRDMRLLLDGPRADEKSLARAAEALRGGGQFGYRFVYPAMRVGRHEVYWHRPLVAYVSSDTGEPEVLTDGPLGYLTAYRAERPDPAKAIELWPRLLARPPYVAAMSAFSAKGDHHERRIAMQNARNLLMAWQWLGERPLSRSFAEAMLKRPHEETLGQWFERTEAGANEAEQGRKLVAELRRRVEPEEAVGTKRASAGVPEALTYHRTARRGFETAYWRTIAKLAHGRYVNKDNADCVRDAATQERLRHHHRDLEALGDYLLDYYERLIDKVGMAGKAVVGDFPFRWQTDFHFPWWGGWLGNQEDKTEERDLVVVIPGRDRRRAVIMADHYDTAYMEDLFEKDKGGSGARLAAAGADDNHSATATLMLGASVFLEMSRKGQLGCDVWLVHLTGEEFPSDCMGARHLAQAIVEGTLKIRRRGRRPLDLSKVRIEAVYVLDMVAHNNDHDPDVFQISPGSCPESLELARQAHVANRIWNASTSRWNERPDRRGAGRGKRTSDPHGRKVPAAALHPVLHGEVRLARDPRSSLYNTDGQIFSDAGIPVVLFMENYDINRQGYHDTHDTMANIDLDYGSAVAAIAIESVARAAQRE